MQCDELLNLWALLLQPLMEIIYQHFIPALTDRDPCCNLERDLLSLPCRLGGLNIPIPTQITVFCI